MPVTAESFTDLIVFDSPDNSKRRQSHHAHFTDSETEALKIITDWPESHTSVRDLDTNPGPSDSRVHAFDPDVLLFTPSVSKSLPKQLIV